MGLPGQDSLIGRQQWWAETIANLYKFFSQPKEWLLIAYRHHLTPTGSEYWLFSSFCTKPFTGTLSSSVYDHIRRLEMGSERSRVTEQVRGTARRWTPTLTPKFPFLDHQAYCFLILVALNFCKYPIFHNRDGLISSYQWAHRSRCYFYFLLHRWLWKQAFLLDCEFQGQDGMSLRPVNLAQRVLGRCWLTDWRK